MTDPEEPPSREAVGDADHAVDHEERIATLEAQNEALRNRLDALEATLQGARRQTARRSAGRTRPAA